MAGRVNVVDRSESHLLLQTKCEAVTKVCVLSEDMVTSADRGERGEGSWTHHDGDPLCARHAGRVLSRHVTS